MVALFVVAIVMSRSEIVPILGGFFRRRVTELTPTRNWDHFIDHEAPWMLWVRRLIIVDRPTA